MEVGNHDTLPADTPVKRSARFSVIPSKPLIISTRANPFVQHISRTPKTASSVASSLIHLHQEEGEQVR